MCFKLVLGIMVTRVLTFSKKKIQLVQNPLIQAATIREKFLILVPRTNQIRKINVVVVTACSPILFLQTSRFIAVN